MKKIVGLLISAFMLISLLSADEMFDNKMNEITQKYLLIQVMLSLDKTDDVTMNAAAIAELAEDLDVSNVPKEHKMHFVNLPENIGMNARKLSNAKDIKSMRAAFTELSKPMAMWASMMMAMGINVAYCSMAPGSWLQKGETIMNPYYGDKMLHCGEIVSKGAEMKHEELDHKCEEGKDCQTCAGHHKKDKM
jgi:membrane fusion protein, copper/silver efflux system